METVTSGRVRIAAGDRSRTEGAVWGSIYVVIGDGDDEIVPFRISSTGYVQYELGSLIESTFGTAELESELSRRVSDIPGNKFSAKQLAKYPGHQLARLSDPAAMRKFKELFERVFRTVLAR